MTKTYQKIVIIAPDSLLSAFRILVQAVSNLELLAAEVSVAVVLKKVEKRPDIVLTYLTAEKLRKGNEGVLAKEIKDLKGFWPEVYCIAIVSDVQQHEEARKSGADTVLFEGVTPTRLLAAINSVEYPRRIN